MQTQTSDIIATINDSTVKLNGQPFAVLFSLGDLWYCQELDDPSLVYSGATKDIAVDRLLYCYNSGKAI